MPYTDPTPMGAGASPQSVRRKARLIDYIERSVRDSSPGWLLFAAPWVLGAPVLFLWFILRFFFGENPTVRVWLSILVYEPLAVLLVVLLLACFVPHRRTTDWLIGALYRARHIIVGLLLFFAGFVLWIFVYGAYTLYRLSHP